MGFGSYDEPEQENRQRSTDGDEGEAVNVHEGELSFETDADTDELFSRLDEIKADEE